jgi:hypothetical protein
MQTQIETEPAAAQTTLPPRGVTWRESLAVGLLGLVVSLPLRGFAGARWSDLPIIKSFADSRLYRQDPFVMALHDGTPAAYPYQLIGELVHLLANLPLDWVLFGLYLPVTILALALLYRIAWRLTGARLAALLFLALYVAGFRLFTIGSAILHSAELTPQTLALPLQLAAIELLLLGRLALAGLLMGLAFNLHAPTSVYLAAALGVYQLLWIRQAGWGPVGRSLALLLLGAAPTLIGSLLLHSDQLPLWALNLARTELATDTSFTINFSSRGAIVYNLLGLALWVGLAAPGLGLRRRGNSDAGPRLVWGFLLASGLMCLGALLVFDLFPRLSLTLTTLVARLQLPRAAWLLNLLGLVGLAGFLVRAWAEGSLPRPLALLLLAPMLVAPPDFVPLDPLLVAAVGLVTLWRLLPNGRWQRLFWMAPWPLALGSALAGALKLQLRELDFELALRSGLVFGALALGWGLDLLARRRGLAPNWAAASAAALGLLAAIGVQQADNWLYASAHKGGLKAAADFQEWARTQTPLDSVFLLLPSEPNNNTFYANAERAVYLVRERANQAVYFRSQSLEFERRVRALGIDQPLRYREELDPAYRRLTEDQVRQLAQDFGVTYFVPARAGTFAFPIAFQAGGWTVYQVGAGG